VAKRGAVKFTSLPYWAPLTGMLVLASGVLGAVMFGLAGDLTGRVALPAAAAGATVEILPDAERKFSIAEIAARPDAAWQSWGGQGFIRANAREAVWVRVTLPNRTDEVLTGVMGESAYYTDVVDFWARAAGPVANWRHAQSGEWTRRKPVSGRSALFAVQVPARESRVFYLRAEDHFAVWLGLSWWPDREQFSAARTHIALAEGIYYGALFALFFYNAVLWRRLKFPDTGYYLGYLGGTAGFFFAANGGFPQFITALGSPWVETVMMTALTIGAASVAQFGRVFLELSTRAPRADRLARWMRNGFLLSLPLALATPWMPGTLWLHCLLALTLIVHGTMLVMALIAWRAGAAHARYFVLAFGFLFMGFVPVILSFIIISPEHWKMLLFLTGSVMEMLLLSLAMADRFARIQRERTATQEQLVEELAQREAIQEAYADELEVEVGERTRELQQANEDKDRMIAVIGHDLRGPVTALTVGAEQAAGRAQEALIFVEEAAQTGRQVLLLIEDLVLWARLRAGQVHRGAHLVRDFATQVAALHRPLAAQRGIMLEVAAPETLRVSTDLVLAQTLVRNLVANAVRFAKTRVMVSAAEMANGVRIMVADDGPGLPPEAAAMLSGQAGAAAAGANVGGLGLRLCVEIARALAIRIDVKTGEGAGAEFSFTLPKAEGETTTKAGDIS
jgi:signal transduction histidine kinase